MWLIFIFTLAVVYVLCLANYFHEQRKTINRLKKENSKLKELLDVQDKLLN